MVMPRNCILGTFRRMLASAALAVTLLVAVGCLVTCASAFSSVPTVTTRTKIAARSRLVPVLRVASALENSEAKLEVAASLFPSAKGLSLSGRRQWLQQVSAKVMLASALGTYGGLGLASPSPAYAGGLLQFPISEKTQPLKNKYHFMRAAPSELEMEGIYSTNPLFLTNRENAMHPSGEKLVLKALDKIKRETDLFPTVAYHSLAANGMDTGDLIARELKLGREKLLPEFTYLDQRGVGQWDSGDETLVKPAVWALDYLEAGEKGMGGRPPANTDGTPNESLGDQFIRLRQFLSLQESRTAGETILVIFPDGTGPALLSCMIAGIPYKDVHALEYEPGEVRLDISPESVWATFNQKKDDPAYLAVLEDGKQKLATLRKGGSFKGLKEEKAEQIELELEAAYQQKKQENAQREKERQQKLAEERRLLAEQQKKQKEEKEVKRREQQDAAAVRRKELAASRERAAPVTSVGVSPKRPTTKEAAGGNKNGMVVPGTKGSSSMAVTTGLGVLGLGILAVGASTGGESLDTTVSSPVKVDVPAPSSSDAPTSVAGNETKTFGAEAAQPPSSTVATVSVSSFEGTPQETKGLSYQRSDDAKPLFASAPTLLVREELDSDCSVEENTSTSIPETIVPSSKGRHDATAFVANERPSLNGKGLDDEDCVEELAGASDSDTMIQEHLLELATAEQAMKDALTEASIVMKMKKTSTQADDYGFDDGAEDWLQALMEIRDEDDDDEDIAVGEDQEMLGVNGLANLTSYR